MSDFWKKNQNNFPENKYTPLNEWLYFLHNESINDYLQCITRHVYVLPLNKFSKFVTANTKETLDMLTAVFCVVAPCSLVEIYQRLRGPCCLHHQHPDYGGSKVLWNVGKSLPDYMVLQPRRQSLYQPPWEPQILLWICWWYIFIWLQ
jgi:hypothetical protein